MKKNTHKATKVGLNSSVATLDQAVAEAEGALTQEDKQALAIAAAGLAKLDRDTTAQTFERGRHFAAAKAILPPNGFGKWLGAHTSYTVRHAWNHIAVDEKLGWHRSRCEAASIPPTTLFILATAESDQVVEDVMSAFERGERLTGARVKNMIAIARNEPTYEAVPMNVGALKGFLKAAELRNRSEGVRFDRLTRSILVVVESAAETIASGKHVTKKSLSDSIEYDARHVNDFLKTMLGPMMGENLPGFMNWRPGDLERDSAWGHAQAVFNRLGNADDWPDRKWFPTWLTDTVLPVLRFVVHGEALPGFEAKRAVEQTSTIDAAVSENGDVRDVRPDDETAEARCTPAVNGSIVAIETERRKRRTSPAVAA